MFGVPVAVKPERMREVSGARKRQHRADCKNDPDNDGKTSQ